MTPEPLKDRIIFWTAIVLMTVGSIVFIVAMTMSISQGDKCRQTGVILIGSPPYPYPQFTCEPGYTK